MDFAKFLNKYNLTNYPVGFNGCRTSSHNFDICDYDITVFDNKSDPDIILPFENDLIHFHHGSFKDTKSKTLLLYHDMKIIQDASWDLKTFLSQIREKKSHLFHDFAKNCLLDSLFSCKKCLDGIHTDIFAPCWQKCASFYLSEAICALNQKTPSPSHMLDWMRIFEKNPINEMLGIFNETIGIERATPTLLERMLKSTIGFSGLVEKNNHNQVIEKKYNFFINNSMFSDCYFYLGFINKEIFVKIPNITNQPDLIYVLRTAMDVESDPLLLKQYAESIQKACNQLITRLF